MADTSLILSSDTDDLSSDNPDLKVLHSTQTLEPGHYWTATKTIDRRCKTGETLLLLDVFEFEGNLHSIKMRFHPKYGEQDFTLLVGEFLDSFVPCHNAEEIRNREQQDVLKQVADIQDELVRTQNNPSLMIEAVKPEVDRRVTEARNQLAAEAATAAKNAAASHRDLAKTHRRAARRSAAMGNPLVVPKIAVSNSVAGLIDAQINESGVSRLRDLALEQTIVAEAQSEWLTTKTEQISQVLKSLTPYIKERAAVALARSSGAIKWAKQIQSGIASLDLYTGRGVDVYDVCTGKAAPTDEPLTLFQSKRFVNEELAAWAEVGSAFDFENLQTFFDELGTNKALLDQVLPSARCVVSIAVLRREMHYENAFAHVLKNMENKRVFLLVRNGENVHAVYSAEPSHEGAHRLFPTQDELGGVFTGTDGSRITITDIEFGKASEEFNDLALTYRRFLILLCGLDHRLKLLGDFYPASEQMRFMTIEFQQRFFRFITDDETQNLLGDSLPDLSEWMMAKNSMLQSGSRVFVLRGGSMTAHAPELTRRQYSLEAEPEQFNVPLIATREGKKHIVTLRTVANHRFDSEPNVRCILSDESAAEAARNAWWLCVDGVSLEDVRRYRHSRINRAMGVGYLRLFRRLENYLEFEAGTERAARDYLLKNATTYGGLTETAAKATLDSAVRNWRAAHRGAPLPEIEDMERLNEVLTLMIPAGQVPEAFEALLADYLQANSVTPLILTRSGKNRYFLYVEAGEQDKAPYPTVLTWGWVRKIILEPGKRKMRELSSNLIWLLQTLPASEVDVRRWPGHESWLNEAPEPITLRKYAVVPELFKAAEQWTETLRAGPGSGMPDDVFDIVMANLRDVYKDSIHNVRFHLTLPVAAYSSNGRELRIAYMRADGESVLKTYCSVDQLERVRQYYDRRFYKSIEAQAHWGRVDPCHWSLVDDKEALNESPEKAFTQSAKSWQQPDWAGLRIKQNETKRKHRRETKATWSLNRSFDELAGSGCKLRRAFYLKLIDSYKWSSRFETAARGKQLAKETFSQRYQHPYKVNFSTLVWAAERRRSNANTLFVAPLLTHTDCATRRAQAKKHDY